MKERRERERREEKKRGWGGVERGQTECGDLNEKRGEQRRGDLKLREMK